MEGASKREAGSEAGHCQSVGEKLTTLMEI